MTSPCKPQRSIPTILRGLLLVAPLLASGCQVHVGGQTLPSPFWQDQEVQYFAPGPEFKLAREAAALKEQAAEHISEPQQ